MQKILVLTSDPKDANLKKINKLVEEGWKVAGVSPMGGGGAAKNSAAVVVLDSPDSCCCGDHDHE